MQTLTKPKGKFTRNYDGYSNNMETKGLERDFSKIDDSISNKDITFSHDHFKQMHQFFKKHDSMETRETMDTGQAMQELKRASNSYFDKLADDMKDIKH